ncbi:MAG: SDR family NAD(P)-dependent oxidoreductase, partial [Planctomycetota bacterium]
MSDPQAQLERVLALAGRAKAALADSASAGSVDPLLTVAAARRRLHAPEAEDPLRPHRGKVAVVTGAAGGIGRATVERLHADGAVVVGLDIDPSVSEALAAPGTRGVVCDLTDDAALRGAIEAVVDAYGGIDLVVANAGIFRTGEPIEELGESWDRHIAVN